MFVVLWEFQVKSGLEKEFEKVYGPEGDWAALFRGSPAYRGTRLLRDMSSPRRFFTMDSWDSQAAYDAFRGQNAATYSDLDKRCEVFTEGELHLGSFETSAAPQFPLRFF
jgi:heme-degrading monooxygenase HmoA